MAQQGYYFYSILENANISIWRPVFWCAQAVGSQGARGSKFPRCKWRNISFPQAISLVFAYLSIRPTCKQKFWLLAATLPFTGLMTGLGIRWTICYLIWFAIPLPSTYKLPPLFFSQNQLIMQMYNFSAYYCINIFACYVSISLFGIKICVTARCDSNK